MDDISSNIVINLRLKRVIRNINDMNHMQLNEMDLDEFTREELYVIIKAYNEVTKYILEYIANHF